MGHLALRVEVAVRPLERVVRVCGAVLVVHGVGIWLYVGTRQHGPRLTVHAEDMRAECAVAALLVLARVIGVVDDVPVAPGIDVHERVLLSEVERRYLVAGVSGLHIHIMNEMSRVSGTIVQWYI